MLLDTRQHSTPCTLSGSHYKGWKEECAWEQPQCLCLYIHVGTTVKDSPAPTPHPQPSHTHCYHTSSACQSWRGSPLLRFMTQLDSQDDCDDSIQLDSYFLSAPNTLNSRFQIILALRRMIQLMILLELCQTWADSTQFNSFMSFNAKCCKYTPLHICLNSSPPKLSKSVAKQLVIWCCWHFWELHSFSMRWIKVNILPLQ